MRNDSLLGKAQANLQVAELALRASTDDAVLNIVAYHIQQAIELAIKHALECEGIRYPKAHEIEVLIQLLPGSYADIVGMLGRDSYMFTSWEAKTRYIKGFKVFLRDLEYGIAKAREVIDSVALHCTFDNGSDEQPCDQLSRQSQVNPLKLQ